MPKYSVRNTDEFIKLAFEKHGPLYDYSTSVVTDKSGVVRVTCKTHGPFTTNIQNHIRGQGCNKCGQSKALRTKQIRRADSFAQRFINVHGSKYDYSKVEYITYSHPVCIVCPTHGEFWQTPMLHANGSGCLKCSRKRILDNKYELYSGSFVRRCMETHGSKYDYSKVRYVKMLQKVCIVCPIHGEFWQSAVHHMKGRGCAPCSKERGKMAITKSNEDYIRECTVVHKNKYDYSATVYIGQVSNVNIICRVHGTFTQNAGNHLSGKGCNRCMYKSEQDTRDIIERLTGCRFDKTRFYDPNISLSFYELDGYCSELSMAFEYHGEQHYMHVPIFHQKGRTLFKQQLKDELKRRLCRRKKIRLIEIPYWVEDKELFIKKALEM